MSQFYEYGQKQMGQSQHGDSWGPTAQRNNLASGQEYKRLHSYQEREYQRPGGLQPPFNNEGSQRQQQYAPPMVDVQFWGFNFIDINSRFAAVLSYTALWLTGMLFLLFEKKNRFVRFHAMQSVLFFGGVNVLYILLINIMVNGIPFLYGPAIFAFVIINVVGFVAWIVGMVGAIRGRYVKLPFVGDIAERLVNKGATTVK